MSKEKKPNFWKISCYTILGLVILGAIISVILTLRDAEQDSDDYSSCIELYPLDSCELYQCRAKYSNWIPTVRFNMRNYEVCKIILNKNMSFNESLDLLNTITYGD